MKLTPRAALAALAALAAATPAFSQFRGEQPPVLAIQGDEDAPDDGQAIADAFHRRYDGAHRPSVALFWNRELSDRLARPPVQRQAVHGDKSESANEVGGANGKHTDKRETSSQVTEVSTEVPGDPARDGLDERSESQLRGAFLSVLGSGGLHPVDRSMMVRTAAVQASGAVDTQSNETRGLQGKARYLMEILLVHDAQAPLGVGFQVTLKDVASATILFSDYTVARPPARGPGRWVASNDGQGFERDAALPVTIRDVGRVLALDVMSRMSAAL